MRVGVVAIVLSAAMAGCAAGGNGPGNPNLLAPKLVVQPRADENVTLYVHGAFRDQAYDWIALELDNRSVVNRTAAFSAEETVAGPGFFLHVEAAVGDQFYEARARVDVDADGERLRVAFLDEDGWSEPRAYGAPFEHILDRPRGNP